MAQLRADVPPVLYKFRGDIGRDVGCLLVDRRLYLSSPGGLNDPFDCSPALDLPSPEDRDRLVEAEVANAPLAQQDEVRRRCNLLLDSPVHQNRFAEEFHENHLGRHGVVTLSSSREDPLLWAHYGGSFAGFAVGYRAVDDGELEALPAVPVEYATDRPKISPFGATDWLRVLFTKSVHWSHEREWRYVRMAEDGGHGLLPVPLGSILEVCLGPRMVPADRDSVIRAARNLPDAPRVLQARLHPDRYGLIFADVD